MKIEIRNLIPNPYRNMDEYPVDQGKISSLIKSIESTSFWDNLLARKSLQAGKYEIAYGHHRLIALRKLYGENSTKTVDIPVRELEDAMMLKIMANENAKDWIFSTSVVTETVKAVKEFLDKHREYLKFSVGAPRLKISWAKEIYNFLGCVFSETMIEDALSIISAIEQKSVDEKAIKTLPEPTKAIEFVRAVKQSEKPIPAPEQRKMAKLVNEQNITSREIKNEFKHWGHKSKLPKKETPKLEKFLKEKLPMVKQLTEYIDNLIEVKSDLKGVEWLTFKQACKNLNSKLEALLSKEAI